MRTAELRTVENVLAAPPAASAGEGSQCLPRTLHQPRPWPQYEWGGWGSNPRPADYEPGRRQFTTVRDRPDQGVRTPPDAGALW